MGFFDKDAIIGKLKTIKKSQMKSKRTTKNQKQQKHLLKVPSFDMQ